MGLAERDRREIGERAGIEELGAARPRGIDGEDLVPEDLDLVSMEDGGGIGAQPHAVDGHLGVGPGGTDRRGALLGALNDGVMRPDALTLENDSAPRRRAYDCVPGGDRYPPATDFELHH